MTENVTAKGTISATLWSSAATCRRFCFGAQRVHNPPATTEPTITKRRQCYATKRPTTHDHDVKTLGQSQTTYASKALLTHGA